MLSVLPVSRGVVLGVVVWVEFPGIQGFIFRSRSLLDTIGRSRIVAELTDAALLSTWPGVLGRVWAFGVGSFGCELVSLEQAREFVGWYTRQVCERSDALTPVVTILDDADLASSAGVAAAALRAARHTTPVGIAGDEAWGAVLCPVTGVPAAGSALTSRVGSASPSARSAEVIAAERLGRDWHAAQQARAVPRDSGERLLLPTKLDELGREMGESSKLAVVVADLNGVGALLSAVPGDRVAEAGAALSALTEAWCDALVGLVCEKVRFDGERALLGADAQGVDGAVSPVVLAAARLPENGREPQWFLPLRPWVSAGDDVVMVCESRLAWWLAEQMVCWLDATEVDAEDPRARVDAVLGRRPTVSIGIAVVPVGVSLSKGHALALQVCERAKRQAHATSDAGGDRHGLDWHRGVLDAQSVSEYRDRRQVAGQHSTVRPFVWSRVQPEAGFAAFVDRWLGPGEQSLRGELWSGLRSTVRDTLLTAVTRNSHTADDADTPSEALREALEQLNARRRTLHRAPVELPDDTAMAAAFLDALDLRDEYLRVS